MAFWSQAQPLFIPNLGQWPEPFLAKTPLSYGAVYWEPTGYRMMLLNERVLPEHGHSDEAHHQPNLTRTAPMPLASSAPMWARKPNPLRAWTPRPVPATTCSEMTALPSGSPMCLNTRGFKRPSLYPSIDQYWVEKDDGCTMRGMFGPVETLPKSNRLRERQPRLDSEGQLVLETSLRHHYQKTPYAYILESRKPVRCEYTLENGRVGFKIGYWAKGKTLVIDPTLVFSSFSGSLADNWGYTATYDAGQSLWWRHRF